MFVHAFRLHKSTVAITRIEQLIKQMGYLDEKGDRRRDLRNAADFGAAYDLCVQLSLASIVSQRYRLGQAGTEINKSRCSLWAWPVARQLLLAVLLCFVLTYYWKQMR